MNVPLSILDLVPISEGSDAATALRNTVDLARHAEQWGYRRYWLAEHHFVAVASSSPAVLIGQLAAATERIHVGAAAVQLGYTTAVAVVESFGILDALYPGRMDLGVGRSGQRRRAAATAVTRPKGPPRPWQEIDDVVIPAPFDISALLSNPRLQARMSVLQQPEASAPDFADQVADILAMLDGSYHVDGVEAHVTPGEERRCGRGCLAAARGRAPGWRRSSGCRSSRATTSRRRRRWGRSTSIATASSRRPSSASPMSWCPRTSWWPTTPPRPGSWRRPTGTGCTPSGRVTVPSRTPIRRRACR